MQFCKYLIENGIISVNNVEIRLPINNQKNSKWFKRVLQNLVDLKMIDKKLKEFNVKFESDIDELEEQDIKNLFMFMNIFCKDKVPKSFHIKREGLNCIKIGKYNIAVWCQYEKEKLKFYNYCSDLKNVVRVMLVDDNEKPNNELQDIKQKNLKDDLFKQNECGIAILLGNEFDLYPISNLLNNT